MMDMIKEYNVMLRVTQDHGKLGCDITNREGVLLHHTYPAYSHRNDAIYAALHGLATQNNFSGCLQEAEC